MASYIYREKKWTREIIFQEPKHIIYYVETLKFTVEMFGVSAI